MSYNTITRYLKCDIDRSYGDIEPLGYEKTKTEGEMIDLASLHGCKVIVKNGENGKWYLKGKTKTIEELKIKINDNLGKSRDGVFLLLLE
jgi:hypothetical protein